MANTKEKLSNFLNQIVINRIELNYFGSILQIGSYIYEPIGFNFVRFCPQTNQLVSTLNGDKLGGNEVALCVTAMEFIFTIV